MERFWQSNFGGRFWGFWRKLYFEEVMAYIWPDVFGVMIV